MGKSKEREYMKNRGFRYLNKKLQVKAENNIDHRERKRDWSKSIRELLPDPYPIDFVNKVYQKR